MHIKCTLIAGVTILLFSCTSTKNIQTARVNVDSIVAAEKLKLTQKHESEIKEYQKHLEEMTSSGVTFLVDSCPERDLLPLLLDSTGKANYEKMKLEEKIRSLTAKVKISSKGDIEAEGPIKAAYFSKSLLEKELQRAERTLDSMQVELDSSHARLTRVEATKDKQVKRKSLFGSYAMVFGGGALCMLLFLWWFNKKKKIVNAAAAVIACVFLFSCSKRVSSPSLVYTYDWVPKCGCCDSILLNTGNYPLGYYKYGDTLWFDNQIFYIKPNRR